MKILVVGPNSSIFQAGIAYIAASLKQAGHQVDCCLFDDPVSFERIVVKGYDVIATGGLSSQYAQLKEISDCCRDKAIPVIIGGGIITSEPELMTLALEADYAVIGEGEETIVELMDCIEKNGDLSKVSGICYPKDGSVIVTSARKPAMTLDDLPWPDYEAFDFSAFLDGLKPTDQYNYDLFDNPREYPLITSRSCPFLCTFCYHPAGNTYRQRSVDSFMDELEMAVFKYKINIVSIYDELFSYNEERVYEFCERFMEFRKRVPWDIRWGCQMRVTGLKSDMLQVMRESGCYMVSYGFESYSNPVLESMKKHITADEIHNAVHATHNAGISIQANFIFGDRVETLETAKHTLDFWKEHLDAGILLGFILACPNSEMYQYAIKKGIIKDRLTFIKGHLHDVLNLTSLSDRDFFKLRTMVFKYSNKYYVMTTPLRVDSEGVTVSCPHCSHVNRFNNYVYTSILTRKMMYCRCCRKRFFMVNRLYKMFSKVVGLTFTPIVYKIYLWFARRLSLPQI